MPPASSSSSRGMWTSSSGSRSHKKHGNRRDSVLIGSKSHTFSRQEHRRHEAGTPSQTPPSLRCTTWLTKTGTAIIHSLRPLPAPPEDPHDHDDLLYDPATHDPPTEDYLPNSHGEEHDEHHGPSDSHIDYNVIDSHTHTDCGAPSESQTPSITITFPLTLTLLNHTPSDSHSVSDHILGSPQDNLNSLTLDLRSSG
ncbi:uncharacterized protein LOC135105589 isoform X2 [Scylla paramamosain]|uniref:uncharacterized protein LOC135105589 isoform X2 n=1 Tax=Scylla paramamosain TaxID=85552 RepID=UPI003082EF14